MYHQKSQKQITEELSLADFDWRAIEIIHNIKTEVTSVEVEMEVNGAVNSRLFEISVPVEWTAELIYSELLKLPQFEGSIPI